jgi:hypothetical protein
MNRSAVFMRLDLTAAWEDAGHLHIVRQGSRMRGAQCLSASAAAGRDATSEHYEGTPEGTESREGKMQTRLAISGVVLVLSAGLSVQTATACPQEAVARAVEKWTTVFAENNPDSIMALYSKDAVLWGTLSPTVRSDPAALKAYFVGAFQALPKATVKFGDQLIRVYGDTAVNTGYYTFSYTKDGETKSIPARYSFTFVKDGSDCKIVDHHSSAMPAPTR